MGKRASKRRLRKIDFYWFCQTAQHTSEFSVFRIWKKSGKTNPTRWKKSNALTTKRPCFPFGRNVWIDESMCIYMKYVCRQFSRRRYRCGYYMTTMTTTKTTMTTIPPMTTLENRQNGWNCMSQTFRRMKIWNEKKTRFQHEWAHNKISPKMKTLLHHIFFHRVFSFDESDPCVCRLVVQLPEHAVIPEWFRSGQTKAQQLIECRMARNDEQTSSNLNCLCLMELILFVHLLVDIPLDYWCSWSTRKRRRKRNRNRTYAKRVLDRIESDRWFSILYLSGEMFIGKNCWSKIEFG